MVDDAEKYKEEDEANFKRIEAKNNFESFLYNTENSLTDQIKEKISEEENETITTTLENGKTWLDSHQNEDAESYETKLKESQEIITPIITKLYQETNSGGAGNMPTPEGFSPGGASTGATVEEVD